MKTNKALCITSALLLLSGCSKVGGLFEKEKKAPLEGERISVLELQKSLAPDAAAAQSEKILVPQVWTNKAWPQAGGYPNHAMQNLNLDLSDLSQDWKVGIGKGTTKKIPLNARPVVVGNAVFTLDTESNLSAFEAGNGKRVWRTDVKKEGEKEEVIAGGVSFAEGALYVTNGYDELLAVNAQSGDILWRNRLPSPSRAAPTVLDGRVFVTTLDNRLRAFDTKTGSNLWEYTGVGEMAGLLGAASPAASSTVVVPVFSSGEITALRVDNGAVAWSDNLASVRNYGSGLESLSDIKAMPVLTNGLVLAISFSGRMAAINEATGVRVWQRDISGSETPWVAGNYIYVITTDNQIAAIRLADGSIVWVSDLPHYADKEDQDEQIHWMGPVMVSGRLMVTGSHGEIIILDSQNGKSLASINTKQRLAFGPIVSMDTLYLLSDNGTLMAYR